MSSKFEWLYADCPWGTPLIQLLRHLPSGQIVGVGAIGQRRMLCGDQDIRAGVYGDLAVIPEHRRFAPARLLLRSLVDRGNESLDLAYGMPNPKAAALFQRMARTRIGDITRYACILRHRRYLSAHLPAALASPLGALLDVARSGGRNRRNRNAAALEASWSEQVDSRFDLLWQQSDHGSALVQVHDANMARWRFDQCPLLKTNYLLLSDADTGELRAWFACRVEGPTLQVDDFWSHDAATGLARRYVDALLVAATADGYDAASFAFAGEARKMRGWIQAGFTRRTQRPIFGLRHDDTAVTYDIHMTSGDEDQ